MPTSFWMYANENTRYGLWYECTVIEKDNLNNGNRLTVLECSLNNKGTKLRKSLFFVNLEIFDEFLFWFKIKSNGGFIAFKKNTKKKKIHLKKLKPSFWFCMELKKKILSPFLFDQQRMKSKNEKHGI
jgi:hypothetical protein